MKVEGRVYMNDGILHNVSVGLIGLKLPTFLFRMAWHMGPRHSTFPYAKLVSENVSIRKSTSLLRTRSLEDSFTLMIA